VPAVGVWLLTPPAGLVSRWPARASEARGGAGGCRRPQGLLWPRRNDAHGLHAGGSIGGGDTSPSRCAQSPGVRGVGEPWVRSRPACLPPCRGNGPSIAPRPRLCYPYVHPGSDALMTTRAPSSGRMMPPTGLHPRATLGAGPRLSRPGDEPQRLDLYSSMYGTRRTGATPARPRHAQRDRTTIT